MLYIIMMVYANLNITLAENALPVGYVPVCISE